LLLLLLLLLLLSQYLLLVVPLQESATTKAYTPCPCQALLICQPGLTSQQCEWQQSKPLTYSLRQQLTAAAAAATAAAAAVTAAAAAVRVLKCLVL
jgi:hypothetical protein